MGANPAAERSASPRTGPSHRTGPCHRTGHGARLEHPPRPRAGRGRLGAVTAALALLVACGSTPDAAAPTGSGTTTTTAATTTTEAPVPTYALTGLPVSDPAKAARAALVVKIDNVDQYSRPQAGINQADIVWEEKIEGPLSRFAAVFQSQDAADLGPVRSGRSTDLAIMASLNHPIYSFSGANEGFYKQFTEAPLYVIDYDHNVHLYERRKGRTAPYNVFSTSARLREAVPEATAVPEPQFVYRKRGQALPADAVAVSTVAYSFGGGPVGQPVTFTWDATRGGWLRSQKGSEQVDTDGVQIAPANLIVQLVPYVDTGYRDKANTPVPEAQMYGFGDAWIFTEGKAIKATWGKPVPEVPTAYAGADGNAVALTPGQTWVALVPVGADFSVLLPDGSHLPLS